MSGQLSSTFEIGAVELTSYQRSLNSSAISGKDFSRLTEYHKWEMMVTFNALLRVEHRSIWAFLISQKNRHESFTIVLPGYEEPIGNWGGTIQYSSKSSDNSVVMQGFTNNDSDAIKAGDFFLFDGHSKVYVAVEDAASDGSGEATCVFEPALVQTPSASAGVTHTNVPFTMSMNQDKISMKKTGLYLESFTVSMIERIA